MLEQAPKNCISPHGCSSGKIDEDKILCVRDAWLKWASELLREHDLYQNHTKKKDKVALYLEDEVMDWGHGPPAGPYKDNDDFFLKMANRPVEKKRNI